MISQENDNLVIVDWEPNTEFKIELPLGTSFSTGPTRDPFGEKKSSSEFWANLRGLYLNLTTVLRL